MSYKIEFLPKEDGSSFRAIARPEDGHAQFIVEVNVGLNDSAVLRAYYPNGKEYISGNIWSITWFSKFIETVIAERKRLLNAQESQDSWPTDKKVVEFCQNILSGTWPGLYVPKFPTTLIAARAIEQIATLTREREAWIAASQRQTMQIVDMTQQLADKEREIEDVRTLIELLIPAVHAQGLSGISYDDWNAGYQAAQKYARDKSQAAHRAEQAKRESKEGGDGN